MKKILVIAISSIILIMGISLTSCTSDNPYVGEWKATVCKFDGNEMEIEQLFGTEFSLKVNKDGTATAVIDGTESSGEWIESADGLHLELETRTMNLKEDDSVLKYEYDKDFFIIYEKQ